MASRSCTRSTPGFRCPLSPDGLAPQRMKSSRLPFLAVAGVFKAAGRVIAFKASQASYTEPMNNWQPNLGAFVQRRSRAAGFAKHTGYSIVDEFYDAAVSGADPIETRAGFAALLDRIEGNGVRTVIVEDASRFARELMAQELGITLLISRGVQLLTASGDDLTASDDPTRKMMRQIAGAFAEYEKARLVSKLRHARERVRQETREV